MKRLFLLTICALLVFAGLCFADEISISTEATTTAETTKETPALDLGTLIGKLPSLKNSVLYSYDENSVKYAMSFALAGIWKKADGESLISIDAMYVPSDEIGALATIKLVNLGKYITFPILEYINIRPGVFVAANNIGSGSSNITLDYGFAISIIDIKF
jgi:hypothetical protein